MSLEWHEKLTVGLVQQGVWNMPLESMPLAAAYLKATAEADPLLSSRLDIKIHNFRGGVTNAAMANAIFGNEIPDVLAFSVFGWNYRNFGELAATFKQLNPEGWVIFGGPHVSEQGERVFHMFPDVDVVVNGEGEFAFCDLLRCRLEGVDGHELTMVLGVSYRDRNGTVQKTDARPRIDDLGIIPSPFLTGSLDLLDDKGNFRYDVAIIETNRGCPHKCAFCYWGGAVGQKVRAFPIDRLRAELDLFGRLKVQTIVVCDANFGLLKQDVEFVRALIETRERYGYPQALESSWAKNKSTIFYTIVKMLKDAGMRGSFTLALQTLSDAALDLMNRRNMKVNDWEDLVAWLSDEGLDCYAELIWGAPGDTVADFMAGYDRLSKKVSRIAIYPMLLLPNTDYMARKQELGIKSVRGDDDDFEYVLAHSTMTFAENHEMQRFVFWARTIAENAVLRYSWSPLRKYANLSQSEVLRNFDSWLETVDDIAALPLTSALASALGGTDAFGRAITYFFTEPAAKVLLYRWWNDSIVPLIPAENLDMLNEVFRYDILTMPIYCPDGVIREEGVSLCEVSGTSHYVRRNVSFRYDVPALSAAAIADRETDTVPLMRKFDLIYLAGAESSVTSTNHEIVMHFMGRPMVHGGEERRISATEPASIRPQATKSIQRVIDHLH